MNQRFLRIGMLVCFVAMVLLLLFIYSMLISDLNRVQLQLEKTEKMLDDYLDKYKKRDPSI